MYEAASGDFEFGDLFSADWTFDVHVRGDAVPLKRFEFSAGKNRPKVFGYQAALPSQSRDLVLAHGRKYRAVLISDNCEIESVLVRRTTGRLIFAAIDQWPDDPTAAQRELESQSFRRHPLPPEGDFSGGVASFERLFAVGRDAIIDGSADPRIGRLDQDAALDLEIRWNAYATRRGPRSHRDNAEKLALLLTADGDAALLEALRTATTQDDPRPEALDVAAANLLAQTLTIAWGIEGGVLNDMADEFERGSTPTRSRDEILGHLERLRDSAESARRALEATKRPATT